MVLQAIRDRLNGIIAIFILSLLIIPFAFVGVNSYFTSDALNAVAVVNEQEITITEYNQGFQNYRRRMQAQMGAAFDPEVFDQLTIRRQYVDRLIDEELLEQVSLEAGLAVSDERVASEIRNLSGFEVDGEFNVDVYQQRLAAQGMTPQQFENEIRASLVMDQFLQAISASAIGTDWEISDYVRLQDQERAFSALIVPAFPEEVPGEEPQDEDATDADPAADETTEADTAAEPEIAEEAIAAWYAENESDFYSEERVIIEYLELDAAALGGTVEPDEELLRSRFEEQETRFITPESRLASHILIEVANDAPQVDIDTARETAAELSARAREGEDFAALAREASQDLGSAEQGGDLGWIEPGYMVQAFEDALYEMSLENPVSEPVQTGFGWHVINLREVRPAEGMSYTEARDILLAEYQAEADERRFLEQADRMIDIIYEDPTTLNAAAEELGLNVNEAGPFGREGAELGVAANAGVVTASFSDLVLGQGAVSDPVDLGTNHIVLIRLKEHLPEALKPLEEVRGEVVEAVRRQQALDAASERANGLLATLEAEGDIQALAESTGLELVAEEAARRTGAGFDARLREKLFLMEAPGEDGPRRAVIELDDGYAVVQLDSVTDGSIGEDDALREQMFARRISNATATGELSGFMAMLRSQSEIEVFEDRL